MFIGEFTHTLDDKKRIALPSKFRKIFGKSKNVIVTQGFDGCLFVYEPKTWKETAETYGGLGMAMSGNRLLSRNFFSSANEVEIDKSGRILLPETLRQGADIKEKAVFVGVYNRLEVWDEAKWLLYKQDMSGKAEEMAEKLGSAGTI